MAMKNIDAILLMIMIVSFCSTLLWIFVFHSLVGAIAAVIVTLILFEILTVRWL